MVFTDISCNVTIPADMYKGIEFSKLDLSQSLSEGDLLNFYLSRASGTQSGYVYLNFSVVVEK